MNPLRRFFPLLPLILLLAALALPASASAANARVSAKATDPSGDGPAEGDLLRVSADYFRAGKLQISLTVSDLAAVTANQTAVGAFFAKWKGGKCRTEVAGTLLAYETETGKAARVFVEHHGAIGQTGPASAKVSGNTLKLTTAASQLARRGYDCAVFVALDTNAEPAQQLDRVSVRLH